MTPLLSDGHCQSSFGEFPRPHYNTRTIRRIFPVETLEFNELTRTLFIHLLVENNTNVNQRFRNIRMVIPKVRSANFQCILVIC